MKIYRFRPLFLLFFTLFLGCESKKLYDVGSDPAIADLNADIAALEADLQKLTGELEPVKTAISNMDIAMEFRTALRRELHEGERYEKEIAQWIDLLKIQRKTRHNSLIARKNQESLVAEAEIEVKAYFLNKQLKPIKKPWEKRYRTAVEH